MHKPRSARSHSGSSNESSIGSPALSLSPLSDDISLPPISPIRGHYDEDAEDSPSPITSEEEDMGEEANLKLRPSYASHAHRKEVEELQSRQYWREEWRMEEPLAGRFEIGDVSALGIFSVLLRYDFRS